MNINTEPQCHIVLLGDSIFDNESYVQNGLPVVEHLRQAVSPNCEVSLLAVDGDITLDVIAQINELPTSATHLVISVGGNDALQNIGIVNESVNTVGEALLLLSHVRQVFQRDYRLMLRYVLNFELPVTVCTIYNTIPGLDGATKTALALFNEILLQEAAMAKVPVIDLRIICNELSDYSAISPIEPSDAGGHKISQAIHALLESGDFVVNPNAVYFEATDS